MSKRRVKCQATGEYGTSDTFYRSGDGRYFKSQEVYEDFMAERAARAAAREKHADLVTEIAQKYFGFEEGQPYPVFLEKKMKELNYYSDDIISLTFEKSHEAIDYAVRNKQFKSDYNKAQYIFAIIRNNISDVYRSRQKMQKRTERLQGDEAAEAAEERQEMIENNYDNTEARKKKTTDISKFL